MHKINKVAQQLILKIYLYDQLGLMSPYEQENHHDSDYYGEGFFVKYFLTRDGESQARRRESKSKGKQARGWHGSRTLWTECSIRCRSCLAVSLQVSAVQRFPEANGPRRGANILQS